jgi:hypothetical protein
VYTASPLPIAAGDTVRVTKNGTAVNGKRLGNGALARVTVVPPERIELDSRAVLTTGFGHLATGTW